MDNSAFFNGCTMTSNFRSWKECYDLYVRVMFTGLYVNRKRVNHKWSGDIKHAILTITNEVACVFHMYTRAYPQTFDLKEWHHPAGCHTWSEYSCKLERLLCVICFFIVFLIYNTTMLLYCWNEGNKKACMSPDRWGYYKIKISRLIYFDH